MTVPAQVLAAVRSIPHPRQEPDMTMPLTEFTPEQADRLAKIEAREAAPEGWEQRIRAVARAMSDEDGLYRFTMAYWRRLAAAALTADAPLAGQHTTDEEGQP